MVLFWSYVNCLMLSLLCNFNLVLTHIDDLNEGKLNVLKIRNDIFIWILSNFPIRMRSFSLKNLIDKWRTENIFWTFKKWIFIAEENKIKLFIQKQNKLIHFSLNLTLNKESFIKKKIKKISGWKIKFEDVITRICDMCHLNNVTM